MKKTGFALLLLCAALLLGGCVPIRAENSASSLSQEQSQSSPSQQDLFGSARQLEGKVVIAAIFWEDAQDAWNQSDLATAQRQLLTALDFLEEEAARYGKEVEFCYSPSDGALNYRQSSPQEETVDLSQEMTSFYQEVIRWMATSLPQQQLLEQYQAQSICYLLFLHKSGSSFTLPWVADLPRQLTQRELSFLFYYQDDQRIQRQCPYVYAHELLHQFGAIDLYQGSAQLPAESALPDYVAQTYPDEIMGGNTQGHYYQQELEKIGFEISPLTAYCLGWVEQPKEASSYPELIRTQQGALFSNEYYREMVEYPSAGSP